MRLNSVHTSCLALTLLAAAATDAAAQAPPRDGEGGEEKSYSWGLGIAGIAMQKPYIDIDRDYLPIPVIYFENRWVQLMGPTLEFKLPGFSWSENNALSFGARVEFDGSGYKPSDAAILNGMAKRKDGILAGAASKWDNPLFSLSAEYMFDAASASEGTRASLGIERTFFVGEHVMITPSVTAIQLDRKYANYYFGVLPGEARTGRAAYEPGSALNTSFGLRTDYMWGEHHALFLQAEYTALGKEIKRSPLTDRSGESMLFLGYLYRF
jgi:outer membrane protein